MWFVFFKQKTAYEMRISDWSSDVCSSDLPTPRAGEPQSRPAGPSRQRHDDRGKSIGADDRKKQVGNHRWDQHGAQRIPGKAGEQPAPQPFGQHPQRGEGEDEGPCRSCEGREIEEHTSELQSLMRISYAFFC